MLKINKLKEAGIDTDEGIARFCGNQELYEKFLLRFVDEDTFCNLAKAVQNKDFEECFTQSHTLKGVVGNLSMKTLYREASEMCEFFRAKENEKGLAKYKDVLSAYNQVISALK